MTPLEMLREVAEVLHRDGCDVRAWLNDSIRVDSILGVVAVYETCKLDTIARLLERMSAEQQERYSHFLWEFGDVAPEAPSADSILLTNPETHLRAIHAAVCGEGKA